MDITISKEELNKGLLLARSIVEQKTTMPILTNVLISAGEGGLKIAATDLEITALAFAKAEVKGKGSTTVNAKVLAELVRELPDGEIRIKLAQGERLEVAAGSTKLIMNGVSAEEFPSLPGLGFEVKGRMSSSQLEDMIDSTLYAVSLDETRFNLSGVCFEMLEDESGKGKKSSAKSLRLVATDGHRMAMITRPVGSLDFAERVIVPRKGLSEIRKLLAGLEDKEIGIGIYEGFLVIDTPDAKVSMRLIDGEFPDYKQVLPKQKGSLAVVQSEELAQALRRASLMVTDKGKGVRMDFAKGELRISSSSPELGEAKESLPLKYDGDPVSIGFNAKYVADIAASLKENQPLCVELNGDLGPGKFFPERDESYVSIVMPMRLG